MESIEDPNQSNFQRGKKEEKRNEKYTLNEIRGRLDSTEQMISQLKDKKREITQNKTHREKKTVEIRK